jgi:glutamyl/glutaminyl-tRNA synthetase
MMQDGYRGRMAPSPTGFLHAGHALTFWKAQERAQAARGNLILRNEDLDPARARPEFVQAMLEDLRWFGLNWSEGPDCGGPYEPYSQSQRITSYRQGFEILKTNGLIYPCYCSRQEVQRALQAPHGDDEEPVYPGTCRPERLQSIPQSKKIPNWRFRVPDGEAVRFNDNNLGPQMFLAGKDFGDFVVWRHDDIPSYQLAVVLDDAAMRITEVVRGADLLLSTARQLLLYRSLDLLPPSFYHCSLVMDASGIRMAKRNSATTLRALRTQGASPAQIRQTYKPCA